MRNAVQNLPAPRGQGRRTDGLARFIEEAKQQIGVFPNVRWEDPVWNITDAAGAARAHHAPTCNLLFTEHAGSRVPIEKRIRFEVAFADLAKACIVKRQSARGMVPGPQLVFLRMLRYVYVACPLPVRRGPSKLCREHFVSAENAVRLREKATSAYRIGQHLEEFASLIDRHALTSALINFRCSIPRLRPPEDRTDTDFKMRVEKLPRPEVLDALAAISNLEALKDEPFDLLRMRASELLLVGGFRAGEMLTMSADPIVREFVLDDNGGLRTDPTTGAPTVRIGLRYWPEKSGAPVVKWIPTLANPIVERAIEDIKRICAPARDLAKWLEEHPGEVNIGFPDGTELSLPRIEKVLKLARCGVYPWLKTVGLETKVIRRGAPPSYLLASDLKRALVRMRFDKPVIVRDDGKAQSLSRSLFVTFLNDAHKRRAANPFIAMPLTLQQLETFLGTGGPTKKSVFDTYGRLGRDGTALRIRTHDFRRLLNTIAQRGGLSQAEIARWMGRAHLGDNAAYDYRSAKELAEEYRDLVQTNEVYGIIADQVHQLPESDRKAFLDTCLQMMHHTPSGECASNVAEMPCTLGLSCLSGCKYFMRRKNDAKSRVRLLDLQVSTSKALEHAKEAQAEGKYQAQNWVIAQETILRTIADALAIDDDPALPEGEMVTVTPNGKDLGDPLA